MAQVISRRRLEAETWVHSRVITVHVGLKVDEMALGKLFLQLFGSPVNIIHNTSLHTHKSGE
jgi:hypothetical protein